jgi:hypothetical protein
MKKILFSSLLILAIACTAFAQEYNGATAEKRTIASFHGINVGTGIELVITAGETEEVAVSAATIEYRDKIITKVENGILKIYYDNKLNAPNKRKEHKDLKAWVSYKTLRELDANTGAEVEINGTLASASLKISANTGARIKGALNTSLLEVDQNTGSQLRLSGRAGDLKVEGSTGSKFEGEELVSNVCKVQVSTGAQVTINAAKEIVVKASTGGKVNYKGEADLKDFKKSTGGTIKKI